MRSDLEDDFLVLLYDVARQMRVVTDQKAREHESTRAQCIILARLQRQPGLSQNELAAIAEVTPITVWRRKAWSSAAPIPRIGASGVCD